MHLSQTRRLIQLAVFALSIGSLFAAGYAGGRWLEPSQLWAGDDPAPNDDPFASGATPEPETTPDTTEPHWWVPYQEQDDRRPTFHGEINGIEVGASSGSTPDCPVGDTLIGEDAIEAASETYFDLTTADLPDGVSVSNDWAELRRCEDGSLLSINVTLAVKPGLEGTSTGPEVEDGADDREPTISITRARDITWWRTEASEERWSEAEIAGRPAAALAPIIGTIGETAVFVTDPEIDGSTRMRGDGNVSLDLVKSIAEAIYR